MVTDDIPNRGVVDGRRVPFAQVEVSRMRDPDVPMQVKALYCVLLTYADYGSVDQREVWPSRETLAGDLGIAVSTLDRWLSKLVDTGWIEVRKRTWDSGLRRANIYVIRSARDTTAGPPETLEADPPRTDRSGVREVVRTDLEPDDLEPVDRETSSGHAPIASEPEGPNDWATDTTDVDTVRETARTVATMIAENGHPLPAKGSKAAETWLVEMDRLLRLGPPGQTTVDPPSPDRVVEVARWATSDSFWAGNVQSIPKLREKWSQLAIKSRDGPGRNGQPTGLEAVVAASRRAG